MTFRRLAATLPLAVLAALLAHVVGFGNDHAPGGAHAASIIIVLCCTLAMLAAATFAAGLFRVSDCSITPRGVVRYARALLPLGLSALATLEVAEGHVKLSADVVPAVLAMVPVVLAVAAVARLLGLSLGRAGRAVAESSPHATIVATSFAHRSAVRSEPVVTRRFLQATRGRAPPAFA